MTTLEDELRNALRIQAQALRVPEPPALDRDIVEPHRRPGPRLLAVAACLALVMAGVVALAQRGAGNPEPAPPVASVLPDTIAPVSSVDPVVPDTTAPVPSVTPIVPDANAPVENGWVALVQSQDSGGNEIYLARPGQDARRLEIAEPDSADNSCPAWSPDGTRLLYGRLNSSADTTSGVTAELVIVPVGLDGIAGAQTVIALDGFGALEGFAPHPCGTWAPDGRWIALRGPGDVWVVDTQTGEIRRLPDLRPTELEWRPGTDELAISGDMGMTRAAEWTSTPVLVYSVSTAELRQLGSLEAGDITWSPDGSTLAYTGQDQRPGIWLADADGTNQRLLTSDVGPGSLHGIGPVWSPTGERIVYQRGTGSGEGSKVVLVSVADGSQTLIEPPQADGPGENVRWYPFTVSWSPDGATLLYTAWRAGSPAGKGEDGRAHVVAVPADAPSDVTVLARGGVGFYTDHRWVVAQMWGMQPN